jgi:hypothetical protein
VAVLPIDALITALASRLTAAGLTPNIYRTPPTALYAPAIILEPGTPWLSPEGARFPDVLERWQAWAVWNAAGGDAAIEGLRAMALVIVDAAASVGMTHETTDPPSVREHAGSSYWVARVALSTTTRL